MSDACLSNNAIDDNNRVQERAKRRNPRLVTSLTRNVVLIQRIYRCSHGHELYSSSDDVLQSLPDWVKLRMGFEVYHRSAFLLDVIDCIFTQISQGNNFTQIAESVADLHLSNYQRHCGCNDDNYSDQLARFPSHGKVCKDIIFQFWEDIRI